MLTIEDCIALSELTPAEMGAYLLHLPSGDCAIRSMIREDIAAAQARGDFHHSSKLKYVLRHFVQQGDII